MESQNPGRTVDSPGSGISAHVVQAVDGEDHPKTTLLSLTNGPQVSSVQ